MDNYGRNRESISDIEKGLEKLFEEHASHKYDDQKDVTVPAEVVPDIFRAFHEETGYQVLDDDQCAMFSALASGNPGLEISVSQAVQLAAQMTKPKHTPEPEPEGDADTEDEERGRTLFEGSDPSSEGEDQEFFNNNRQNRSSSVESTNTTTHPGSRPPSRGPPDTPRNTSLFDSQRRQRTGMIATPTSWKPIRPNTQRRRSDASNRSDSETYGEAPSSFRRSSSRQGQRSNPVSPSTSDMDFGSSPQSYSRPQSRAHSRANSRNANVFLSPNANPSPDDSMDNFFNSVNSLSMPSSHSDDSSDDEDDTRIVASRSTSSSLVSLEQNERIEALERVTRDLRKQLKDSEQNLRNRLDDADDERSKLESVIEDMKEQLSIHVRDEKDLRTKERQNMTQIAALETEISKVTKTLETSRATYANLQKQYHEQCAASEKYRDDLRARELTIRSLRDQASMFELETGKLTREVASFEDMVSKLQQELNEATGVQATLDEQKQENLMLKETIDRLRFDLDEMRNSSTALTPIGGGNSNRGTLSKSLGAELAGHMKEVYSASDLEDDEEEADLSASTTEVGEDSDDEDIVQTIITRKKRRAGIVGQSTTQTKDVHDQGTQYDIEYKDADASVASIQTDPIPEPPKIMKSSMDIQTDPIPEPEPEPVSPPRVMVEMEVQTIEEEPEASTSKQPEVDHPPAYSLTQEQLRQEVTEHWHPGASLPLHATASLTTEQKESWRALKGALGVDCILVDRLVEGAPTAPAPKSRRSSGRFYNVGNNGLPVIFAHAAMIVGLSMAVVTMMHPGSPTVVPGGPTYYDRQAWESFNTMGAAGEGFASGAGDVWGLIGRVGDGAARIARGWPT